MISFRSISWVLTGLVPVAATAGFIYGNWHNHDKQNTHDGSFDIVPTITTPGCFDRIPHVATPEVYWS